MKKRHLLLPAMFLTAALLTGGALAESNARYEFEDGEKTGKARALSSGGITWVEGLNGEGDSVTLTVTVPGDGFYDLTVCQQGMGGYKENDLAVDGETVGSTVAEGKEYAEHILSHVYLSQGEHRVTVTPNWGYVRLDYLTVAPSAALEADLYDVQPVLCNPAPSKEAQELMNWMCEIYGEKMISGQYLDEYQYGAELKAVASVTEGRVPALVGLDMLNYSPASVSLGSWPTSVDQALGYWKQGHILTFCWHWVAPEKYIDTTGNNWWGGYRTENTTLNLKKAMDGEDPEAYDLLIRDMDAIAEQLKRLRDAGVPVIWRPLHEASGGWFWWGASGPEAYIALYRLMYDRFVNLHGLNNLIWLWNGQDKNWYPGDDVVDIIGEDIYAGKHAHDSQSAAFLRCAEVTGTRKLIMMSECGCVPSPIKCQRDGTVWNAWAVWCYEFVQVDGKYNGEYTSPETLKLFYEQDNVVTLAEVPAFGRQTEEKEASGTEDKKVWSFADAVLTGNARPAPDGAELWGNDAADTASLTVTVPADGEYDLVIVQAGIGGYKENILEIDGAEAGLTVVQGETEEACPFGTVSLTAGEHTVTVRAVWGWVRLKSLSLLPAGSGAPSGAVRYEFEDGTLLGKVKTVVIGGEGYVELSSNDEADGVSLTVTAEQDGYYDLTVIQAGIGGGKQNYLSLDGERISNTVVQGTETEECVTPAVYLTKGEHTVAVNCFWGWTNLDALVISPSGEKD